MGSKETGYHWKCFTTEMVEDEVRKFAERVIQTVLWVEIWKWKLIKTPYLRLSPPVPTGTL
jgi:hypothetical protein